VARKGKSRYRGPRGGGASMMKRLEELQRQMAEAQAALEEAVVTATAGGGAVTIEMTGAQELKSVKIDPEVVDPEDVEMLEDLIIAAFKEAQAKVAQLAQETMGPLAGGADLGIPGLF